ncbi:MAG: hypothetical protein NTV54_11860 [Ignavibacteriales bacterium]|nr:hypothetical protein [Ignavibacteriales bacterium]
MTRTILAIAIAFILVGCSTYKELKPDPVLTSAERGYVPVTDGEKNFQLKQSDKYFVKFPRPQQEYFYLVLTTPAAAWTRSFFTASFDDGAGTILKIKDQAGRDSVSVYAIDTTTQFSYWVIDSVSKDTQLPLTYRYLPQWRYTFETKFSEYQKILEENVVARTIYEAINPAYDVDGINISAAVSELRPKNGQLKEMHKELLKLESVFPKNIAASKDTAYREYAAFRARVNDELQFQSNYDDVLSLFQKEAETRGNMSAFLGEADYFVKFLTSAKKYREPIANKAKAVLLARLDGALPYYQNQVRAKEDLSAIELSPSPVVVDAFFPACETRLPEGFGQLKKFVELCNVEVVVVQKTEAKIDEVAATIDPKMPWPLDTYYQDALNKLLRIKVAESRAAQVPEYRDYPIAVRLGQRVAGLQKKLEDLQSMYQQAATIVQQINTLKAAGDIKGVIGLLRQQQRAAFLLKHYTDVDVISLTTQKNDVSARINSGQWAAAESRLRDLAGDRDYLQYTAVAPKKDQTVKKLEADIFDGVKRASEARVTAFAAANQTVIDDVPGLYADSVFVPVYQLSFSSSGAADLKQKRLQIDQYLDKIKTVQFPESAIKAIYALFQKNPKDRGVEKARAIVEHGKFYKGTDKKIRAIIDECNPAVPKSITHAKDYRELYALPVSSSKSGTNQYVFRIRLNIPSDAEYPVYDVNIKLPQEVAEHARTKTWYDEITINKKVIKTEGRVRITAPTADNGYEAQISPVQMDKAGNNILEIKFTYPGLKVFEISAMAQVPIIRKN